MPGINLSKPTVKTLDDTIETNLDKTLADATNLLTGLKYVHHEIKIALNLWQERVDHAQDVLSRLEDEHKDIAHVLIQQAQDYVDYYARNKAVQKDKIDTLKNHVKQLKEAKHNLSKGREAELLYQRVNAMSQGKSSVMPTVSAVEAVEPVVDSYREIQQTILATNALIELKKESV